MILPEVPLKWKFCILLGGGDGCGGDNNNYGMFVQIEQIVCDLVSMDHRNYLTGCIYSAPTCLSSSCKKLFFVVSVVKSQCLTLST